MHRIIDTKLFNNLNDSGNEFTNSDDFAGTDPELLIAGTDHGLLYMKRKFFQSKKPFLLKVEQLFPLGVSEIMFFFCKPLIPVNLTCKIAASKLKPCCLQQR